MEFVEIYGFLKRLTGSFGAKKLIGEKIYFQAKYNGSRRKR